jgi:hypothetical protein
MFLHGKKIPVDKPQRSGSSLAWFVVSPPKHWKEDKTSGRENSTDKSEFGKTRHDLPLKQHYFQN